MSGPVNPIRVITDNLPDYKVELIERREKLVQQINVIDEELNTIYRLQQALGIDPLAGVQAALAKEDTSFTPVGNACGRG